MSRIRLLVVLLVAGALGVGLVAGPAQAAPRTWPRGTITYVDRSLDPDAVKLAVNAWNSSGLDIRFTKVSSARKARLIIQNTRKVPAGCGSGYGTLGYPGPGRRAYVSILHGTNAGGQGCAWPGQTQVVAHELGHVLGLEHYMRGCSLMNTSHINGVASSLCLSSKNPDDAKPGRWRCRLLEPIDLRRVKRLYGGKPVLREPEWCDAIERIPATGAVTPVVDQFGNTSLTITRAAEPAVPGWLGHWGYGQPGYEIHLTPAACTATPGDDATLVGVGLWEATPVGGTATEDIYSEMPPGPNCLTVWQFDQGNNFARVPTTVIIDGGAAGTGATRPAPRPAFRTPAKAFVI
ncbi:M57 family metalloprotease [Nocardioides sp.]|uniref:M57 family metalloprotease n=1 Tax=Nocardioides sp. TaxID=35761 RepID=UPI00286E9765|nr:M57 family metalloprotease [Nocardioides sp.]